MKIPRKLLKSVSSLIRPQKVLMLIGPRQVGKTFLIQEYLNSCSEEKILSLNGDFIKDREILLRQSKLEFENLIGDTSLLFIDEAQKCENINLTLKILVDHFPKLKIIVSGSAAFELMGKTQESLAGRLIKLTLLPIAQLELSKIESSLESSENLFRRIIYGSYPEVITMKSDRDRERYLNDFVEAFLFKDIFEYEGIKNSIKIKKLLQLLALQLGHEVSLSEIGSQLAMDKETVGKYLDLLEKTFVIYARTGFSTANSRKEINKSKRYYFYDNGVRNTVINNFNPLEIRSGKEIGQIWENYILGERLKYLHYSEDISQHNSYFWRTYNQSEIDLVEEGGSNLYAYEIKWSKKTSLDAPVEWQKLYPHANFLQINRDNYLEFIGVDYSCR